MKLISKVVGDTLGPGGLPVLLERQETGFPNIVTKDGVTVFRYFGFTDAFQQAIMETARDASVRTATEAGDGPLPVYTPVLTPNGWSTMAQMKVGDKICATDGTVQTVQGVYEKGQKEVVKITFADGRVAECCEDHYWTVTDALGKVPKKLTVQTSEMIKNFVQKNKDGTAKSRYYIETVAPELSNCEFVLDPYLVGVLIGDGSLSDSGSIELSLGKSKEHILSKLKLPPGIVMDVKYVETKNSFRVKLKGEVLYDKGTATMRKLLGDLGLRNTQSGTKFVPDAYKFGSRAAREAILQGLLDTDGYKQPSGRYEFNTISEQLAEDVVFLIRSLGGATSISKRERSKENGSYSDTPVYRVLQLANNKYGNKIVNIERTGRFEDMMCIKVSHPNHLFIVNDFIATHNTTTATVLSEAFVRKTDDFIAKNPKVSPQKVVRLIEKWYRTEASTYLKSKALTIDDQIQRAVALCSSNGDHELTDAVMKCFEITGDEGNVTITEASGPSGYKVTQLQGYAVGMGYEESCKRFYSSFLNDQSNGRSYLKNPVFILYNGHLTDITPVASLVGQVMEAKDKQQLECGGIVLCALSFSETVMASLAANFEDSQTLKVFPLTVPINAVHNSQLHFLQDLQAITSAEILEPLSRPIERATVADVGLPIDYFEAMRYRSNIVGVTDEGALGARIEELKVQLENPESLYEKTMLEERVAKLSGGIARLTVIGASAGEIREKKDRADDAVCGVRGALKHGAIPGGGWGLMQLSKLLKPETTKRKWYQRKLVPKKLDLYEQVKQEIIFPVLREPIRRLMANCGLNEEEIAANIAHMETLSDNPQDTMIWDGTEDKFRPAVEAGVVDSLPAVNEALRNSISIATLLGSLGGIIVFQRDDATERTNASDAYHNLANSSQRDREFA